MTLVKGSAGHCDMSKEADSGIRETAVPSTHDKSMPFLADTGDCFPSRAVVLSRSPPSVFQGGKISQDTCLLSQVLSVGEDGR